MKERIGTILAVMVLTIAIWVWADLEQTSPPREVVVPVKVVVPPDFVLHTWSPHEISVTFQGPKGEVEKLMASPDELVCRLELSEQDLRGQELSKPMVLHATSGFRDWASRRLIMLDCKGDHGGRTDGDVEVNVDRLVHLKVRVEPRITGAVATAATTQPAEVDAQVAELELRRLPEASRFAVAPLQITSMPLNPQVEREVTLDRRLGGDGGIDASFDPPIVKLTARLESSLVTKSLGRFPILISAPPEVVSRYRVVFQRPDDRTVEVEVQGPAPDVERLQPADIRVQMILTPDDKPNPAAPMPAKLEVVGLPPGIKLAKPLPTVNFFLEELDKRPPAAP
jgi:hypothetical protein